MKTHELLTSTVAQLYGKDATQSIDLGVPPRNQNADYCFNIGTLAKSIKRNPKELTQELQEKLANHDTVFKLVSIV